MHLTGAGGLRSFDLLANLPTDLRDGLVARLSCHHLTLRPPPGSQRSAPPSSVTATVAATRRLLTRGRNPPLDPQVELELLRRAGIPDIDTDTEQSDLTPRLGEKSILPIRSDLVEALEWGAERLGVPAKPPLQKTDRSAKLDRLLLLIYAPALGTRLGLALLECLDRGWLPPGKGWSITVDDPLSATAQLLPSLLELLSAIGTIFNERVAPDECRVDIEDGGAFLLRAREIGSYEISKIAPRARRFSVRIVLRPEWSSDPEQLPHPELPEILITGAEQGGAQIDRPIGRPIGRQLKDDPLARRRPSARSIRVGRALTRLLAFVFAKKAFHPGQLAAIHQVLRGTDCVVSLPGGGRGVVYQLAGLLRSGCTLVVEPTRALIENQSFACRQSGIDRVAQLSRRPESSQEAAADQNSPFDNALFVFVRASELRYTKTRARLARLAEENPPSLAVLDQAQSLSELSPAFTPAYTGLPELLRSAHASSRPAVPILALLPPSDRSVLRDLTGRLSPVESPCTLIDVAGPPPTSMNIARTSPSKAMAQLGRVLSTMPKRFGLPAARFYAVAEPQSPRGVIICSRLDGPFGIVAVREQVRGLRLCSEVGLYSETCPKGLDPNTFAESRCRDLAAFERGDLPLMVATSEIAIGTEFPALRYVVFFGLASSIEALVEQSRHVGLPTRQGETSRTERHLIHITKSERRVAKLLGETSDAARVRSGIGSSSGVFGEPDDLLRALAAHVRRFPEPETLLEQLTQLLETLESRRQTGRASLEFGDDAEAIERIELSLARLTMLGAVLDWSIEDDGTIAVTLSEPEPLPLTKGVLELALRTDPSSVVGLALRIALRTSTEAGEHSLALCKEATELIERCIEPTRREAIARIRSLAAKTGTVPLPPASTPVRGTVGKRLETLADHRHLPVASWLELFSDTLIQEGPDLEKAAASLAERYPESSGVSFAAALGELYTRGDRGKFASQLTAALSAAAHESSGDWSAARDFFDWIMPRVRIYLPEWSSTGWTAWRDAGGPHHLLGDAEVVSLAGESASFEELSIVLTRRLRESCDILESLKEHYTMDAAEL